MTPDDITDRLSRLEITQEDGESAPGIVTETASSCCESTEQQCDGCNGGVEDACHRISQINGTVSNGPTKSDSVEALDNVDGVSNMQLVKDAVTTNDDEDDGNDDEAEEDGVSDLGDSMSVLMLESSAAADDISGEKVDGTAEAVSDTFSDVTIDEASRHDDEGKQETDCGSVVLPEMSAVTYYEQQQQHSADVRTAAWNDVVSANCSQQHSYLGDDDDDDDDDINNSDVVNGTAPPPAAAAADSDECLDSSSLMANSMYSVFALLLNC